MTDENTLLDYDDLEDALGEVDALPSAAELHGHLLGCLAVQPALLSDEWLSRIERDTGTGALPASARTIMEQLHRQTVQQVQAGQLGLTLALPDENSSLAQRVEALAQWCQGFLAGFGLSSGRGGDADVEETLRDFAAVAQAGFDPEGDDAEEDAEDNFFQIAEYVRLAAAQLCWEARMRATPQQVPTAPEPGDAPKPTDPGQLFKRRPLH